MTHKFQRKARNLLVVLQYRFRENVAKIGIFATNLPNVSHGGRSAVGEGKADKKRELCGGAHGPRPTNPIEASCGVESLGLVVGRGALTPPRTDKVVSCYVVGVDVPQGDFRWAWASTPTTVDGGFP